MAEKKSTISINRLLKYALEDITEYRQAVNLWLNPPEDCPRGYLLIFMLSFRFRANMALEKIKKLKSERLRENYIFLKDELIKLWSETEKELKKELNQKQPISQQLTPPLYGEILHYVKEIKKELLHVRKIAQDGDLFDAPDWTAENIKEPAEYFLLHFQDLYLAKEQLREFQPENDLGSKNDITFSDFENGFHELEGLFKENFGYFYPVAGFISKLHNRDYSLDVWWLTERPGRRKIPQERTSREFVKRLKDIWRTGGQIITGPCPEPELVISHALGELKGVDNIIRVRKHILGCRKCLDLFLDARLASSDIIEVGDQDVQKSFREMMARYLHEVTREEGRSRVSLWDEMCRRAVDLVKFLREFSTLPPSEKEVLTPPIYYHIEISGFVSKFSFLPRTLIARSRRAAPGAEELRLEVLENPLEIAISSDEQGDYYLLPKPGSKEIIRCSAPASYQDLFNFIKEEAIVYQVTYPSDSPEPQPIVDPIKLKIEKAKVPEGKKVIIGLSGDSDKLQKAFNALYQKDKDIISQYNVIWIMYSLE